MSWPSRVGNGSLRAAAIGDIPARWPSRVPSFSARLARTDCRDKKALGHIQTDVWMIHEVRANRLFRPEVFDLTKPAAAQERLDLHRREEADEGLAHLARQLGHSALHRKFPVSQRRERRIVGEHDSALGRAGSDCYESRFDSCEGE